MAYNLGYVDSGGYNLGYSGVYDESTPSLYPYVFTDHGVADDNSFLKSANFASTQQIDLGVVSDFDSNKLVVNWQAISDDQLWRSDINTLDDVTVVAEVDTTTSATLRYRVTETGEEGTFTVTVNIEEELTVEVDSLPKTMKGKLSLFANNGITKGTLNERMIKYFRSQGATSRQFNHAQKQYEDSL